MTGRRRWLRRAVAFALWSVPALALTFFSYREAKTSFAHAFLSEALVWYYWALITPVILEIAEYFPLETVRSLRGFSVHLGSAIGLGMLAGILAGLCAIAFPTEVRGTPEKILVNSIIGGTCIGLLFYSMVASVGFALVNQERLRARELAASKLEARLVEAQLGALRMQLHPHFLFNTLNTIAMFMRAGDAPTSIRLLARLSELLRHLLDDGGTPEVPLRTELEYANRYLDIEGTRFSDRLRVDLKVPDHLKDALVPNLLLQPLLENAIRHGIAARASAGTIELSVARSNGKLQVHLRNEGPNLPPNWSLESARGIGLRNTAMRLHHLYGNDAKFDVRDWPNGVEVNVALPYHTRPQADNSPHPAPDNDG